MRIFGTLDLNNKTNAHGQANVTIAHPFALSHVSYRRLSALEGVRICFGKLEPANFKPVQVVSVDGGV